MSAVVVFILVLFLIAVLRHVRANAIVAGIDSNRYAAEFADALAAASADAADVDADLDVAA